MISHKMGPLSQIVIYTLYSADFSWWPEQEPGPQFPSGFEEVRTDDAAMLERWPQLQHQSSKIFLPLARARWSKAIVW